MFSAKKEITMEVSVTFKQIWCPAALLNSKDARTKGSFLGLFLQMKRKMGQKKLCVLWMWFALKLLIFTECNIYNGELYQ